MRVGLGKRGTMECFLRAIDYSCGDREERTRRSRRQQIEVTKNFSVASCVSFVTFVFAVPVFGYCGSTSTVTFTPLARVVQPEAVYCNRMVSPLTTEKFKDAIQCIFAQKRAN